MERQTSWIRQLGAVGLSMFLLIGFTGCGSSSAAKTNKVTGTVKTAEGPLKGGSIAFVPTGGKSFNTNGQINADGTYTLTTFEENDGAPVGDYAITISDAEGNPMTVKDNPKVTVVEGANTFDFTVEKGAAP